jgi:hypothetical protein
VPRLAELFVDRWRTTGLAVEELPALVKTLFNHVALSPYTALVDHLVALLARWAAPNLVGPGPVTDIFSYLLRHLVRHLAAYDLATFHNLGDNYPDALMLDALLRAYLVMIESHPDEFEEHVSETPTSDPSSDGGDGHCGKHGSPASDMRAIEYQTRPPHWEKIGECSLSRLLVYRRSNSFSRRTEVKCCFQGLLRSGC